MSVLNKFQSILFSFNPVPSKFQPVLGLFWAVPAQFSLRHVRSNQFMVSLARLHCVLVFNMIRTGFWVCRSPICYKYDHVLTRFHFDWGTSWVNMPKMERSKKQRNVEETRSAVFSQSPTQRVLILLMLLRSFCFYYSRCSLISLCYVALLPTSFLGN